VYLVEGGEKGMFELCKLALIFSVKNHKAIFFAFLVIVKIIYGGTRSNNNVEYFEELNDPV